MWQLRIEPHIASWLTWRNRSAAEFRLAVCARFRKLAGPRHDRLHEPSDGFRGRRFRVADDDGDVSCRHARLDRDGAQDIETPLPRRILDALAKDRGASFAVGTGEVRHVFDHPKDLNI